MLHRPRRSHRRDRRPPRHRIGHQVVTYLGSDLRPQLSVTVDTLRQDAAYLEWEMNPNHLLIIIRDQIEFGALIRAYQDRLPVWARRRLYASFGSVDPADDPDLAASTAWWDPEWPVGLAAVSIAEDAYPGLITPYEHAWLLNPPA